MRKKKKTKEFRVIKSYTDIQRMKLEKLMSDPQKPVHIPARPVDHEVNRAPEFNHNIMGSSAGAGSGEFHVYRQMRRKEAVRTGILHARKMRDDLNEAYHQKLEENQRLADEKTAKKRKKRQKQKGKGKKKIVEKKESSESESDPETDPDEVTEKRETEEKIESSNDTETSKTSPEVTKENDIVPNEMKKDLVIYYD